MKSIGKAAAGSLDRLPDRIIAFFNLQEASGYLLLVATIIALVVANSPYGDAFIHFWHTLINLQFGTVISFSLSVEQLINDALMTVFFTVVGLEIKRELIEGALSTKEQAMLPVVGALGGMAFPAVIYLCFNSGTLASAGWAIPTATDIAFSLAVIQMLGKRVPLSLKVFLTALAVVDDLGAIIVIAVFYSSQFDFIYFGAALLVTGVLIMMNRLNVRSLVSYFFIGAFLWLSLHKAGVHATISGVILALLVPFGIKNNEQTFSAHLKNVQDSAPGYGIAEGQEKDLIRYQIGEEMQKAVTLIETPLSKMLQMLSGISAFIIMPLFAFCNAGVKLSMTALQNLLTPLSLGIFFALLIGKSLGITLTTVVASKLKLTRLPQDVSITDIFLVNILAGIGFTMSVFITNLAFNDVLMIETAKLSIIITSFTAGLVGFTLIKLRKSNPQ